MRRRLRRRVRLVVRRNRKGASAPYPTPIDNPYVVELLHRLGLETVESLLEKSDIFTRNF
jgi:hypothetical protein